MKKLKLCNVHRLALSNEGDNTDGAETQAAGIVKGRKAFERCLAEKVYVPNAVSRGAK